MATNPMQRKARNSFLLGMVLTLLLTGAIIAFLVMQLMNIKKQQQAEKLASKTVSVLGQDVKSGETIDSSMLKQVENVSNKIIPSNAVSIGGEEVIAKTDLKANTIITSDLVTTPDSKINNDTRTQEYNTIVLPINLEEGDYVDIRLSLPSGQSYIVVSKKKVEIPDVGGTLSTDTIRMTLSEDEILAMSNAIYDAFKINGSKLEAVKYAEPGTQTAATPTYPVNAEVSKLLVNDPNILKEAMAALNERYSKNNLSELRNNYINSAISGAGDQAQTNAEQGMTESITNSKESRKQYLEGLSN